MLLFTISLRITSNASVYFYFFILLLHGELIDCGKEPREGILVSDVTSLGNVWHQRRTCFNMADPTLVEAKQFFQDLAPYRSERFEPMSDETIRSLLLYFSSVAKIVERLDTASGEYRMSIAWYDTIGDYVQGFLLPVAKYCFYSGNVSYQSVHSVLEHCRTTKLILNTDGNEWTRSNFSVISVERSVVALGTSKARFNCSELFFNISSETPLPKVEMDDDEQVIISLWVPLKSRQFYDPRSKKSLSIIRIYYQTVDRCIPRNKQTRKNFEHKFLKWIDQNIVKHLMDDQFYPGLQSILRVKKTLEASIVGKVLTKKSIEESANESDDDSRSFFKDLFAPIATSSGDEEYYDDENKQKQDRLYFIKVCVVSIGLGLLLLILIVIVVKIIQNRRVSKQKAKYTRWKSSDRRRFSDNAASDEEVLLALDKKPPKANASETSESCWRYVRSSNGQKVPRKSDPSSRHLMPALSDSEEDSDPIPFQPKKHSAEHTPLIGKKETGKKRKKRCGRGCLCINCIRAPRASDKSMDIRSSSQYKLVDEMGTAHGSRQSKGLIPIRECYQQEGPNEK